MKSYLIIIPCYNEASGLKSFLSEIELILCKTEFYFTILIVDDCSLDNSAELIKSFEFNSFNLILKAISLKSNVGHQEAIRQGLAYAESNFNLENGIIIMDGDGEDDPNAILKLIEIEKYDIVFVERGKRYENMRFKLGYFIYRQLFNIITGKKISFGNYSMISVKLLKSIANQNFIHYPSFLYKQKCSIIKIKFDRRKRVHGNSKMNQKSLILHGLYSLIEFSEEVLYFLMRMTVLFLILDLTFGSYIIYSKYKAQTAILGWASSSMLGLIIITLILICTIILGLLLVSFKKILTQKSYTDNCNIIR